MKTKRYEFTVGGQWRFPHDMLRYDQCWPRYEADTVHLGDPMRGAGPERTVRMEGLRAPTEGRWNSFGWHVNDVREVVR